MIVMEVCYRPKAVDLVVSFRDSDYLNSATARNNSLSKQTNKIIRLFVNRHRAVMVHTVIPNLFAIAPEDHHDCH